MTLQWEKVYVFISSTFNDMHAERDYLVKQVFPQLQEWCERRKLRLVDVDLRWGVTEADASQNKRVVQVCLERIDACRPFFLCFLGQRRGWVPDRDDISAETYAAYPCLERYAGDASVTELEILHAFVNPLHSAEQARAEHSFFYLREPETLNNLPDDVPQLREVYTNAGIADPTERRQADEQLAHWREVEIPRTERPAHTYSAEWDAGASTPEIRLPLQCPSTADRGSPAWEAALRRWSGQWAQAGVRVDLSGEITDPAGREKAEQYNAQLARGRLARFTCNDQPLAEAILADLQAAISARYSEHVEDAALTMLQRELDQQSQFLEMAGEGFIEREGDFDALDRYARDTTRGTFFLTAPGGLGKTSLLARWIDRAQLELQAGESLHYRFIGASDESTTVDALLRSLLGEIKETTGKIEEEIPSEPDKLRAALPRLLKVAGKRGKTVLVLDGLNQLESGLSDLGWLALALPDGVKLVASFKRGEPQAEAYYERLRAGGQVLMAEVRPFESLEDRRKLVRAYLSQFLKELDERHLETLIHSEGAGNPLYLKVVLAELRVFGVFGDLGAKIRGDFGCTPVEAFSGLLRRLESDPAYSPVQPERLAPRVFGWLAHAHTGLTASELGDLLVREGLLPDDKTGKQRADEAVYGLLRQVRPYLSRREGRTGFFYESFDLAVRERYARGEGQAAAHPESRTTREWHASLAEYFDAQPLRLGAGGAPNQHKLAELAYQLAHAGMGGALRRTLWDYPYMVARLEGSGIDSLIADYDLANLAEARLDPEAQRRLGLVQEALRLSTHVVHHDARQLPSQLTGRLLRFSEPEFSGLLEDTRRATAGPWLMPLKPTLTSPGGPLARTIDGHRDAITAVAVNRDSKFAASGSRDGTLRLWDLDEGKELKALRLAGDVIAAMTYTPDERHLVCVMEGSRIPVRIDLQAQTSRKVFKEYQSRELDFLAATSGGLILSAHFDGTLALWDPESGEMVDRLKPRNFVEYPQDVPVLRPAIVAAAVAPDGRHAGSATDAGELTIWDIERRLERWTTRLKGVPTLLSFSADGRTVLAGTDEGIIETRLLMDGTGLQSWQVGRNLTGMALSSNRKWLLCGFATGHVKIWDLEQAEELGTEATHLGEVRFAHRPGSERAVSFGEDTQLRVWNLGCDAHQATRASHRAEIWDLTAIEGGRFISASADTTMCVWDAEGNRIGSLRGHGGKPTHYQPPNRGVTAIDITCNDRQVIAGDSAGGLRLWNIEGERCLWSIPAHGSLVTAVRASCESQRIISASRDRSVKVWDLKTGAELAVLAGHQGYVSSVRITPDGKRAVTASSDKTLKVWNLEKYTLVQTLAGLSGEASNLVITADGKRLFSTAVKKSTGTAVWGIAVWDLDLGVEVASLETGSSGILAMAITPGGESLISGDMDGVLRVWDLEHNCLVHTIQAHSGLVLVPGGNPLYGLALAVTPDGKQVVSASVDQQLRVWDLASGHQVTSFSAESPLWSCAIATDAQTIVAGDLLGRLHFLRLENVPASEQFHAPGIRQAETPPGQPRVPDSRRQSTTKTAKPAEVKKAAPRPTPSAAQVRDPGEGKAALRTASNPGQNKERRVVLSVTAADSGDGPVVCCPACQHQFPIHRDSLGSEVHCTNPDCQAILRLDVFVARSTQPKEKKGWKLWKR